MTAGYVKTAEIVSSVLMSEPQYLEGDDVALKDECDECGNFIHSCECDTGEPDRMYGDEE
jgi:hypothetical protein